jgi:hypothetical protein
LRTGVRGSQLETPVVFIVFRRPDSTARVFEEIKKAQPKKLFIIADGPRRENPEEAILTSRTRSVIENVTWPCEVIHIFSENNLGLRERVLSGLDEVFATVDQAIILEDDCLPSQSFFAFCSTLLGEYSNNQQVGIISGFNFSPYVDKGSDYFFSRSPHVWGWATWASTWNQFRSAPQVESWSKAETAKILSTFSSRFQRAEFLWLMRIAKTLNTWDISLFVWMRQSGFLSVIPRINLVSNIGFGSGATHTKFEAFDLELPASNFSEPLKIASEVKTDHKLERRIWRKRRWKWFSYPITHPMLFSRKILSFILSK